MALFGRDHRAPESFGDSLLSFSVDHQSEQNVVSPALQYNKAAHMAHAQNGVVVVDEYDDVEDDPILYTAPLHQQLQGENEDDEDSYASANKQHTFSSMRQLRQAQNDENRLVREEASPQFILDDDISVSEEVGDESASEVSSAQ
eukprot:CAMPEP_0202705840 /NCGR_PEP_ID=MMETSP1385-20130828/18352_1 /ASSEMBLY_ACC=CAM_ASM_000861 /TAXON_ID=933848 /ORGANISM="Elphidium margaritaceum" /LENGTH=144 /DNA_ID=CAMNT_0049364175 /DNA_START=560 /DNA_END=994 /DNA_ORIENTATION=+